MFEDHELSLIVDALELYVEDLADARHDETEERSRDELTVDIDSTNALIAKIKAMRAAKAN